MTATLAQTQADLPRLLELVSRGEDVVITVEGQPKARLTRAEPARTPLSEAEVERWMGELAQLRARLSTGKTAPTAEELINEDRTERV
jgi:prevent-host-death family protein